MVPAVRMPVSNTAMAAKYLWLLIQEKSDFLSFKLMKHSREFFLTLQQLS